VNSKKLCKKFTLPVISVLGIILFLTAEICFEQIAVFTDISSKMKVETWQMFSCIATPIVKESLWDSLNIRYSSSFKLHFYDIAILIVLTVTRVIYGFYKMTETQDFKRKKPVVAQLISVIIFVGLCILACFTAFFRTGTMVISPISAILMTVFFLIFGINAGVYTGTWLYEKPKLFSRIIPSIISMVITIIMYIGEMVMMGWDLFRFGSGFMFDRLGFIPLSLIDILIIILSGIATYFILTIIKPQVIE